MTELGNMSWRRFNVLVAGLSVNSSTVQAAVARQRDGGVTEVNTMRTPEQAQHAFVALFGGFKAKPSRPRGRLM